MSETTTFRRGGAEAIEASKSAGGAFAKVHYLTIEDEGQVTLRYITDAHDWLYVLQHASVPTKNPPKDYQGNWPKSMPAVCRYDEAFAGRYSDCYIDDAELKNQWGNLCKATTRIWALAVLREEVIGTKEMAEAGEIESDQIGKRLGYRDQTREIAERDADGKETGKTRLEPAIVVCNFASNNYFGGLYSLYTIYNTVTDRDYVVKKTGQKKDVNYNHIPLAETPNLHGAYVIKNKKGEVVEEVPATDRWNEKYPPAIKEQNLNLDEIVADKASDEYYARFFDPNKTPAPRDGESSSKGSAPEVPEGPGDGVDAEKLAAMRERVRGHSSVGDID